MTIQLIHKGQRQCVCGFLSRKPIKYKQSAAEQVTVNVMFIEEDQFLNTSVVAMEIMRDPVLGMVLQFTQQGWRNNLEPVFQPYYSKRLELSHEDGILLWNSRVVVPDSLQAFLLADVHAEHLGMVKMKQLARKYCWWPGLDKQIEETVKLWIFKNFSAKNIKTNFNCNQLISATQFPTMFCS